MLNIITVAAATSPTNTRWRHTPPVPRGLSLRSCVPFSAGGGGSGTC